MIIPQSCLKPVTISWTKYNKCPNCFKSYARSYKVEVLGSKHTTIELKIDKSHVKIFLKSYLAEMKGFIIPNNVPWNFS